MWMYPVAIATGNTPRRQPVLQPRPSHRGVPDAQMRRQHRLDQCVTPSFFGGRRNVAATIVREDARPPRPDLIGQSTDTAALVGARQLVTVGRDTPTRAAISTWVSPSAASNTIRARCANPALSRAGIGYREVLECEDGPTVHAPACAGRAVAVTTELPNSAFPGGDRLVAIDITDEQDVPIAVRLHAAWMPHHYAAPTIHRIAEHLRCFTDSLQDAFRRHSQVGSAQPPPGPAPP
jgi:hypothetical protein